MECLVAQAEVGLERPLVLVVPAYTAPLLATRSRKKQTSRNYVDRQQATDRVEKPSVISFMGVNRTPNRPLQRWGEPTEAATVSVCFGGSVGDSSAAYLPESSMGIFTSRPRRVSRDMFRGVPIASTCIFWRCLSNPLNQGGTLRCSHTITTIVLVGPKGPQSKPSQPSKGPAKNNRPKAVLQKVVEMQAGVLATRPQNTTDTDLSVTSFLCSSLIAPHCAGSLICSCTARTSGSFSITDATRELLSFIRPFAKRTNFAVSREIRLKVDLQNIFPVFLSVCPDGCISACSRMLFSLCRMPGFENGERVQRVHG